MCAGPGGVPVFQAPRWRVIRVEDEAFPAFYRVVWGEHVAEFSSLTLADRQACMEAVCVVERELIAALAPLKINLAALGNVVPHLHWHVIARFAWDSHFPQPIWGASQRVADDPASRLSLPLAALDQRIARALGAAMRTD